MNYSSLAFAFRNNISEKILRELNVDQKVYLKADEKEIIEFVRNINFSNTSHILGLGVYTGRDQNLLRIETVCTNKFRNQIQGNKYEEIAISNFIEPTNNTKYARRIGNSYCNLVSYLIMKSILNNNAGTQYSFIHIPKLFGITQATDEINKFFNKSLKSG